MQGVEMKRAALATFFRPAPLFLPGRACHYLRYLPASGVSFNCFIFLADSRPWPNCTPSSSLPTALLYACGYRASMYLIKNFRLFSKALRGKNGLVERWNDGGPERR